jgi:hypothetical protein
MAFAGPTNTCASVPSYCYIRATPTRINVRLGSGGRHRNAREEPMPEPQMGLAIGR